MIDLKKPIRRKSDRALVGMISEIVSYYVEPVDDPKTYKLTRAELEAIYENIPEPRKPREWRICSYNDSTGGYEAVEIGGWTIDPFPHLEKIRVIEWPKGAPLPDWPEGY